MPINDFAPYSFLIVEDVNTTRMTLQVVLEGLGAETIHLAENGQEAISMLQGASQNVDCVICDFNMPVMNGVQMVKQIRCGLPGIRRDIPILMLTGHGDRNLIGLALALDVNGFLLKPAKKLELFDRLARILEFRDKKLKPSEAYLCVMIDDPLSTSLPLDNEKNEKPTQLPSMGRPNNVSKLIERQKQKRSASLHARTSMNQEQAFHGSDRSETQSVDGANNESSGKNFKVFHIDRVAPDSILARDVTGSKGKKLLSKGTILTRGMISSLKDLIQIGEPIDPVAVYVD